MIDEEEIEESMGDMSALKRKQSSHLGSINASINRSMQYQASPQTKRSTFKLDKQESSNLVFSTNTPLMIKESIVEEKTEEIEKVP